MSDGAFFLDEEPHSLAPPLLRLQPAGNGGEGESLSSYMKRLAGMHRQPLRTFLLSNAADGLPALRSHLELRVDEYLDGVNDRAGVAADWLERRAGASGLRYCTLTSLSRFVCGQKLIALSSRVCLDCFAGDRREGRPMFERLLWRLQPVTVCDLHRRALVAPNCQVQRPSSRLKPPDLPGVCPRCGSIGLTCATEDVPPECSEADIWVTQQCRRLLDAMPSLLNEDPMRMKEALRDDLMHGPGIVAAATAIGMVRASLSTWLRSPTAKLMLFRLLDIALTQQLDLVALLRGDIVPSAGPADRRPRTPRRKIRRVDHAAVERRLKQALESGDQLAQVARELNVSYCTLERHEELYRQVSDQARTMRKRQDTDRRQLAVQEAEHMVVRLLRLQKTPSLLNARIVSGDMWMPSTLKATALACIRVRLGHAGVQLPTRAAIHSAELRQMLDESAERIRQQFG